MPRTAVLSALAVLPLSLSCSDGPPTVRGLRVPAALQIVSGDEQRDTVGRTLAQAIVVRVVDSSGQPLTGIAVNFHALSGSVFAGVSLSNANGQAGDLWTLGTAAGEQVLEARYIDPDTFRPILIEQVSATAVADTPKVIMLSPSEALTFTGDSLQIVATQADSHGNASAGAVVWSSSNANVATIDGTGKLRPVAAGTTTVTAAIENLTAQLPVVVFDAIATDFLFSIRGPTTRPDTLYRGSLANPRRVALFAEPSPAFMRWSPDRERFAFQRNDPLSVTQHTMIIARADGTDTTRYQHRFNNGLTWDPSGTRIIFGYYSSDPEPTGLLDMNSDTAFSGSTLEQTGGEPYGCGIYPDWSPDSTTIVVAVPSNPTLGGCVADFGDLVLIDLATKTGMRITTGGGRTQPRWSPDGTRIAFVSRVQGLSTCPEGSGAIMVMNADGSAETIVHADAGRAALHPTWSPDGEYILFSSNRADPTPIFPDGSCHPFSFDLWALRLEGSVLARLTATPGVTEWMAAWWR